MKIEINIRDKLYKDILLFCNNDIETLNKQLLTWIEDSFYTMKYGDLNQIFGLDKPKETEVKKEENVVVETANKTVENVTDTKKKKEVQPKQEKIKEKEVSIETPKRKTSKRTLTSK